MASAASFSSGAPAAQAHLPHVAIFPFMAKGHTIPLTHLALLLRRWQLATVTFFTTSANAAFVRAALSSGADGNDDGVAVVELPFPDDITSPGLPRGAESAEALDSLSSFPAFVEAASLLRPRFEEALAAARPPATAVVADALLHWAHAAAAARGVLTLAFFAANVLAHVVREACHRDNPAAALSAAGGGDAAAYAGGGDAAAYAVPEFPDVQLSLADIPFPFEEPDLTAMASVREMDRKLGKAIAGSHGLIVNTFEALERRYIEHWNRHVGPRAWPLGPLCLARQPPPVSRARHGGESSPAAWMQWLDEKAAAGRGVAGGLERSGLDFLWAVRPADADLDAGFEDRVRGRGVVVREWVDQWAVLWHGGVKGFLSHGGWNSVVESISAGVPLAVWPMSAEQPLNAKMVADELRVGIRVPAKDGVTGATVLVKSEEIARVAVELVTGEKGVEVARNMAALGAKAREGMEEGGSSWRAVEEMIAGLGRHLPA
ncbi:unnamed protein product [Urochloa decumbens]|uniref:Glycosyltransferase n=1 Tax=Urochloa decumbens TaxID=240449 RepID=A0ABC9FTZ5_9POAL